MTRDQQMTRDAIAMFVTAGPEEERWPRLVKATLIYHTALLKNEPAISEDEIGRNTEAMLGAVVRRVDELDAVGGAAGSA
jgi:hypothetical protein